MTGPGARTRPGFTLGRLAAILVGLLVAASVGACSAGATPAATPGTLTVTGAWVRVAPDVTQATAGYLVIANAGSVPDTLLRASSPGAASVEVHETSADASGMMGMHPVDKLAIPAGGTVALAPGGYHLMIMGLTAALAAGDHLELDLVFDHAGTVTVQAEVRQG